MAEISVFTEDQALKCSCSMYESNVQWNGSPIVFRMCKLLVGVIAGMYVWCMYVCMWNSIGLHDAIPLNIDDECTVI